MRARQPDDAGTLEVDGITIAYETFGSSGPAVMLMPTWCVVDSHAWKLQVPYLSRHFQVITWDGPGNGGSSRPTDPAAYTAEAHVRYALAVLDTVGIDRVTAVASSGGTHRTIRLAAEYPERVGAVAFVGPKCHLVPDQRTEITNAFLAGELDAFLDVFMGSAFTEPHSTKAIQDGIEWGHATTMEILHASRFADTPDDLENYQSLCMRLEQPVLVVQGTDDRITPEAHGRALAEAIGDNARLVLIDGGGHRADLRDPVRFSLLLRDFVWQATRTTLLDGRWMRATRRRPRALVLSSPVGLGHAQRDLAIARELRAVRPELEVTWLTQDPVTRVLHDAGETVHPASRDLAHESAHMTSESAGHDLHCFRAWRRMDEILVANFMVLHDVLEAEHYDLIIADEAWEADHFLHENPELKRGAFAWITDFVGWLPTSDGDDGDASLAADYNLEMIEHIDRYPWVRDLSLFVGEPGDVVPLPFGPDLPRISDWTRKHFAFPGYITGFDAEAMDTEQVRADLGYGPDELICIATVGGSGIGTALLTAIIDAYPEMKAKRPELRMIVVTGPRIDPDSFGSGPEGLELTGYVSRLYRHLAVCDIAIVQGGLTTAMELTAHRRPFLYFPLRRHFEQQIHVPHRLGRYRAGRKVDLHTLTAGELAAAALEELDRPLDYEPVATDGARRAAELIAQLL